jgi:endonuclease YncB( thermonuclease family)
VHYGERRHGKEPTGAGSKPKAALGGKGSDASACSARGGKEDADLLACTYKETPPASLKGMTFWAKCVRVVDGDTAHFAFRPGSPDGAIFRYRCRLRGYNTAEMRGKSEEEREKALAAKKRLSVLLTGEEGVVVGRKAGAETEADAGAGAGGGGATEPFLVQIVCGENDKYGRPLVDVVCPEGDVCEIMIREGYAKAYNGRGPKEY